jgi:hypothetical protein
MPRNHYYVRTPGRGGDDTYDIVTADGPLETVVTLSNCTDTVAWMVEAAMNMLHRATAVD